MDETRVDQQQKQREEATLAEDIFGVCAQCSYPVKAIKGDSHNYCDNCGFRDSCC